MAGKFPPNLDDGELWLPSDIFLNEVPSKLRPRHYHEHHQHHLPFSCMDDLARHFASLLLPKQPTNIELLKPPAVARYGSVNPMLPGNRVVNNDVGFEVEQRLCGCGCGCATGPFLGRPKPPVYDFQFMKPTPASVDSDLEVRVLQRQQIRNRGLPVFGNGLRRGLGAGFLRESGGTGVFHPRMVNTSSDSSSKRLGIRSRHSQDFEVIQQRNPMKRVGARSQQDDCYYHLPPEMGLPGDWSY